jgi:hypothetical protein
MTLSLVYASVMHLSKLCIVFFYQLALGKYINVVYKSNSASPSIVVTFPYKLFVIEQEQDREH